MIRYVAAYFAASKTDVKAASGGRESPHPRHFEQARSVGDRGHSKIDLWIAVGLVNAKSDLPLPDAMLPWRTKCFAVFCAMMPSRWMGIPPKADMVQHGCDPLCAKSRYSLTLRQSWNRVLRSSALPWQQALRRRATHMLVQPQHCCRGGRPLLHSASIRLVLQNAQIQLQLISRPV